MEPGSPDSLDLGPEPRVPPGWPTDDALPVHGWGEVALPLDELWDRFADVAGWSRWNPCISVARIGGGELSAGSRLRWVFRPIKRWYLYRLPAQATIVEVIPGRRVTWEVRFPGFHAFHSYMFDDDDAHPGSSRFGSWEIAEGWMYRALRRFWLAHFRFVRDASIAGAVALGRRGPTLATSGPTGNSDRPPIVVIPGIDGQPGSVAPIVERLARDRQVLLVDYSTEIESELEDLAAAIAELLPERFDLVGQSIGSWLATEVARQRRGSVGRVVLIATFTRTRPIAVRLSAAITRITPKWLYRATTPSLMALVCGPVGDGGDHPFLAGVADSDREGVARRTRWQVGRRFTEELRSIASPTLVLMGARDRFVPRRRRDLARLRSIFSRPDDRVVAIDDAGHVLLPTAAIERAVGEIENFLR